MKTLKQIILSKNPYFTESNQLTQIVKEWLTEKRRNLQQQKTLYYPTTYQTKETTITELIQELEEQQ